MRALRGLSPAMTKLLRPSSLKPTTPGLTVSNRFLRAGLRGEPYLPKGLGRDHSWHISNLPKMKLDKVAALSPETKHELAATGVIGAIGAGTSALTHRVMSAGLVKNTAGKAALIGGGLGLLGDYAAVKLNKKLSPEDAGSKVKTMTKVANILRERASEIRQSTPEIVAVELLKQAGMSDEDARFEVIQQGMEKAAAAELTYKGIDHEEAVRLVKAAGINVRELQGVSLATEEESLADLLEKAAAFINAQDEVIAELQAKAGEFEKAAADAQAAVEAAEATRSEPALPDSITKLAGIGALTFDDIEALKAVPAGTLTKVASAMEQPWEFGKAAGLARGTGDAILDFCMG